MKTRLPAGIAVRLAAVETVVRRKGYPPGNVYEGWADSASKAAKSQAIGGPRLAKSEWVLRI